MTKFDIRLRRKQFTQNRIERYKNYQSLMQRHDQARIGQAEIRHLPYETEPRRVALHYQAADVYLHAAFVETFPLAVLEALACGVPVVATAVGGIPEQIVDGEVGFLVGKDDAQTMAARLELLLRDGQLRARFGQLAAARARERFDVRYG